MPEGVFKRPAHRLVHAFLSRLDREFLAQARCYFAGGTRIVLELGEYRESRDVYFLCSDRDGYRLIREGVSETSLGPAQASALSLAREVRAGLRSLARLL